MKKSILLKNVFFAGEEVDILIIGNRFEKIVPAKTHDSSDENCSQKNLAETEIVECRGLAIFPPFCNAHTHAAMSLLRGVADDIALFPWLNDHIWPLEAKLTARDIYEGSRLAALEMIRSGTVFFNDMYFEIDETVRAARELGLRAVVGMTVTNFTGIASQNMAQRLFAGSIKSEFLAKMSSRHTSFTSMTKKWKFCGNAVSPSCTIRVRT